MIEWLGLLHDVISTPFIAAFVVLLVVLTLCHRYKLAFVGIAFPILSFLFVHDHGDDVGAWLHHFGRHEEYGLLYNLALLLPGFAMLAYYFEHSGIEARLALHLDSDGKLLAAVSLLSAVLDNIAAAMIGGVLVRGRYGRANAPFTMLVGVICASNLGGAPSPFGDTTTVMLWIAGKPIPELAKALVGVLVAMLITIMFAARHGHVPLPAKVGRPTPVKWALFWPMLGIPGFLTGNILVEQPGLGLWTGIGLGCLIGRGRIRWSILSPVGGPMTGMYFLVALVASASMLPTAALLPVVERLSATGMAYTLGVLSAVFDNIPLTKLAIDLGGFDWGLLAYAVGFGGSAMWFGSSAGIALGTSFPELFETRRWLRPFVFVQIAFFGGFLAYVLWYSRLVPLVRQLWS